MRRIGRIPLTQVFAYLWRDGVTGLHRVGGLFTGQLPGDWDSWLAGLGSDAGFCQTSKWAAINAEANGAQPFAIAVEGGSGRRAGALLGRRQAPVGADRLASHLRLWAASDGGHRLECFEGPVFAAADLSGLLTQLLGEVDTLARRLKVTQIHFQGGPAGSAWAGDPEIDRVFAGFGYQKHPWLSALVDLTHSEENLCKSFRHAARKGIRKCVEAGVTVAICRTEEEFIHDFCASYYEASGKPGVMDTTARRRALAMWRLGAGFYRFFVARATEGDVLATLGTYSFNGVATEIMSARMALANVLKLPAQDLLHWEVFRAHKAVGDRLFNLAGFSPDPQTPKEAGIRRFKEKWGGRVVEVPRFHKTTLSPPVRLVRGISRAIRRLST